MDLSAARWQHSSSDFEQADGPPTTLSHCLRQCSELQALASVGVTTLALGFAEACLHLENRPIPLGFATRFALCNAVPSTVWKTISAPYIAAASNLPLSRLVAPPAAPFEPKARAKARRLIAIKSIRCLRFGVSSYGLVWSMWQWHSRREQQRFDQERECASAAHTAKNLERVVRIAPAGSALTAATRVRHGEHILHLPWQSLQQPGPFDWSAIGIDRVDKNRQCGESTADEQRLKLIEVEVDVDHAADVFSNLRRARLSCGAADSVHTVGIVSASATPAWQHANGVDVYFFALSGVVRFLCQVLDTNGCGKIAIVSNTVKADAQESDLRPKTRAHDSSTVATLLRKALVYRRGIPVVVRSADMASEVSEHVPAQLLAVIAPTIADADAQIATLVKQGIAEPTQIVAVVEESLLAGRARSRNSRYLDRCADVLSISDTSDRVLQFVREQLRAGKSPDTIQRLIFEAYGEQSALLFRADELSATSKYI